MQETIIIGLLQNTAILLAISMIYDYWWIKNDEPKNLLNKILTGLVIGIIGIILMLTPWIFVPGIVFDTRSVVLSVSGLFFGGTPTLIAIIMTGLFRISIGGDGIWMGLAVIISSGSIGIFWNRYRSFKTKKYYCLELLFLGLTVHLTMLACTLFLPADQIIRTLKTITVPLLTIYPTATVLLGTLMVRQFKNWQNKKAAENLIASEQRFTELLKHTLLFSTIIDTDAKIIFCNQSLLATTGYTIEELIGKNYTDIFISKDSREEMNNVFNQILKGEEGHLHFENSMIFRNGESLLVSWNNTLLRDSNGNVTGVASIGENITKRKQAESELINAKIKAEESDMLKSIFLANMSHEIRTPMNAIMGFSALLGENNYDYSEKVQYIEIIKSSSNRLLQLINDIIDLSKLESNQLVIRNSDCSLSEIFINSAESFRKNELLLKKPEIEFKLKLSPEYKKIRIRSDGIRIQQVLDNLITNAIKYTERGIIETGFSIKSENGREFIEIFVKDSGIGISREKYDLVFERFRQVEEGVFHEGAGLGLSISKGIVDLLGGKIWFTSEVNIGSTFFFSIPYIIPESISMDKTKKSNIITQLSGKTVIIAEDDFNSYKYLELLLKGQNAKIIYVQNGKELMNLLNKSLPDLILLDINMPIMSGFEVLAKMKSDGIEVKTIAQTAYALPDEKERCLKAGCNGYISKPINKNELFEVINNVLLNN